VGPDCADERYPEHADRYLEYYWVQSDVCDVPCGEHNEWLNRSEMVVPEVDTTNALFYTANSWMSSACCHFQSKKICISEEKFKASKGPHGRYLPIFDALKVSSLAGEQTRTATPEGIQVPPSHVLRNYPVSIKFITTA
jgi:hypothetical protein